MLLASQADRDGVSFVAAVNAAGQQAGDVVRTFAAALGAAAASPMWLRVPAEA